MNIVSCLMDLQKNLENAKGWARSSSERVLNVPKACQLINELDVHLDEIVSLEAPRLLAIEKLAKSARATAHRPCLANLSNLATVKAFEKHLAQPMLKQILNGTFFDQPTGLMNVKNTEDSEQALQIYLGFGREIT